MTYFEAGIKALYAFILDYYCPWCSWLDAESVENLKRKLLDMGYSIKAVKEILKLYKQNNALNG